MQEEGEGGRKKDSNMEAKKVIRRYRMDEKQGGKISWEEEKEERARNKME